LDAAHVADAPLKIRKRTDIIGSAPPPRQAARNVHRELFFLLQEKNHLHFMKQNKKQPGDKPCQRRSNPLRRTIPGS
jgi:hypothetical protein